MSKDTNGEQIWAKNGTGTYLQRKHSGTVTVFSGGLRYSIFTHEDYFQCFDFSILL
jgi:hypothetical protein